LVSQDKKCVYFSIQFRAFPGRLTGSQSSTVRNAATLSNQTGTVCRT